MSTCVCECGRTHSNHSMSEAISTGQSHQKLLILAGSVFHHIWLVKHQIARAAFQTLKIAVTFNFEAKRSTGTGSGEQD